MKKILAIAFAAMMSLGTMAQTAQQVLDKTAAVIGNKKGATANFKLSSPKYGSASGTITIKGNKFNARNYQVHLVANNQKRTVAEMYITINKNTHVPSQVKMRQGSTWSTINISGFKAKGVSNNSFVFNSKEFPGAEVIDLR